MFISKKTLRVWALLICLIFLNPTIEFANHFNIDPCADLSAGGLITGSQVLEFSQTASAIWQVLPPTSLSNSNDVEYQWMVSILDPYDFSTYSPIAGATAANFNPGHVTQTSYYLRCARTVGCDYFPVESNLVTIEVLNILAVELTDFSVKIRDQFTTDISWTTDSEFNNKHFEVERSENGREFMPVGIINGQGTTTKQNQYFFQDQLSKRGKFYYRLKAVEFGGVVEYSNTLEIRNLIDDQTVTKIFPNPVEDRVNIDFKRPYEQDITLELFNSNLKLIESHLLAEGEQFITFNMNTKVNGIYFIKIPTSQGYKFERIIRVGNY